MKHALILAAAFVLLPIAASAQTGAAADLSAADQISQGPMIVEQVHNGFLVAPDFKVTELDRRTSGLAGVHAGLVFDDHFFIGGGGYLLTTERRGRDMGYGGLVLGWLGGSDGVGFSAKVLLGGGSSTSSGTVQMLDRGRLVMEPFRARQSFLVAEPELDATLRIAPHVRLAVGAGYRFTGNGRHDRFEPDFSGTRLDGAVGSIGLQIGGGR